MYISFYKKYKMDSELIDGFVEFFEDEIEDAKNDGFVPDIIDLGEYNIDPSRYNHVKLALFLLQDHIDIFKYSRKDIAELIEKCTNDESIRSLLMMYGYEFRRSILRG